MNPLVSWLIKSNPKVAPLRFWPSFSCLRLLLLWLPIPNLRKGVHSALCLILNQSDPPRACAGDSRQRIHLAYLPTVSSYLSFSRIAVSDHLL